MQKVTIPWKDKAGNWENVGIFYFEEEEEASRFAKDVTVFINAVVKGSADKDKIVKKYKGKAYANFFSAFAMVITQGVTYNTEKKISLDGKETPVEAQKQP